MNLLHHILSFSLFSNTLRSYCFSVATFLVFTIIMWIIRFVLIHRLHELASKTETDLDDFLIDQFNKNAVPLLYFGVFYASTRNLIISPKADKAILFIGIILMSFFGIRTLSATIKHALEKYLRRSQNNDDYSKTMKGLFPTITIILWSVGLIFLLDNLGFNISAVVAGLGIGGIAVALAAQAMLGDLFSYFAILLDKPFELGDTISLEDFTGTVEKIGIKTSRLKSISGEQVIFSNSDLTKSRIHNFKRMEERRVVFKLNVSCETPKATLSSMPEMIKTAISGIKNVRFDRAHLSQLNDWAMTFEVVYFVTSGDYTLYMDIQQEIYLSLIGLCEERKIQFPYPTQTINVVKS